MLSPVPSPLQQAPASEDRIEDRIEDEDDGAGDALTEGDEECAGDPETITLRFRLGTVVVKQEPVEEPTEDAPAPVASPPPCPDAGDHSKASGESGAGDLRSLFAQQQQQSGSVPAAGDDASKEMEQKAQLEAAQIASYEANVTDKKHREAEKRELVRSGNLAPCEELDQDLMCSLYAIMLQWLEIPENRLVLFRFLELKARAIRWYEKHAQAYFDEKLEELKGLIPPEEETEFAHDAVAAISNFLHKEIERIEVELFAMPEKGQWLPKAFGGKAPEAAGAAGHFLVLDD